MGEIVRAELGFHIAVADVNMHGYASYDQRTPRGDNVPFAGSNIDYGPGRTSSYRSVKRYQTVRLLAYLAAKSYCPSKRSK